MKKYVIIAGVNGAGKSTLYQTNRLIENMARVNLDEIVRGFGDWRNPTDVSKAGKIAVRMINEYFEKGISFNQETTLCGKSIINNILKAKALGYSIEMYFVGLESAKLAKERVKIRVINGGHGIPEADIERRYEEALKQLVKAIPLCDSVKIFDNTAGFTRIAEFHNGKCCMCARKIPKWYVKVYQEFEELDV